MTFLSFFCPCVPPTATHQAKKIARRGPFVGMTDKPELVAARRFLEGVLVQHQPAEPVRGPVSLSLQFTWPWRAGDGKQKRALGRIPKDTKPDCSNLAKTLEDRLAALCFIEDDANVVELHVAKFFGDTPGIFVEVRRWQDIQTIAVPQGPPDRPSQHGLFQEGQPS